MTNLGRLVAEYNRMAEELESSLKARYPLIGWQVLHYAEGMNTLEHFTPSSFDHLTVRWQVEVGAAYLQSACQVSRAMIEDRLVDQAMVVAELAVGEIACAIMRYQEVAGG